MNFCTYTETVITLVLIHRFLLSISLFNSNNAFFKCDACFDKTVNLTGTCQLIYECIHVHRMWLDNYKIDKIHTCGWDRDIEIVCCGTNNNKHEPIKPDLSKKYVRKCEEYKINSFGPISGIPPCANYTKPFIVGGTNSFSREFPHMALLGCKNETAGVYNWECGGSLISTKYVLTAAHCFEKTFCNKMIVRLGELNFDSITDDARTEDFNISRYLIHGSYTPGLKYDDIALVELESKVNVSEYIRPACLPYKIFNKEAQLTAIGWGSRTQLGGQVPHLQKVDLKEWDSDCKDYFLNLDGLKYGVQNKTQICAGSENEKKDTCRGDSGGPLQSIHPIHPCMYSIIGITSFGTGCGNPGIPALYTRVFPYIKWIESEVWKDED